MSEAITTLRKDEGIQIPPTEFRIIQPFMTTDGEYIYVYHDNSIQTLSEEAIRTVTRVSAGVFIPKDPFAPISPTNPLTLNYVPGFNYHIGAKNTALLTHAGLRPEALREFADNNKSKEADLFNLAWTEFINNFAIDRYGKDSMDYDRFISLLNNANPKYLVEDRNLNFGGTSFISNSGRNTEGKSTFAPIIALYLYDAKRVDDIGFAIKAASGIDDFIGTHRDELLINPEKEISPAALLLNGDLVVPAVPGL